jgi:cell division protein FtsW (lipid II flippase)
MSPILIIILLAYIGLIVLVIKSNTTKAGKVIDRTLFFITVALLLFSYVSFLIEPLAIYSVPGWRDMEPKVEIRNSIFYPLLLVFLLMPLLIVANLKEWKTHFSIFPIMKIAVLILFIIFSVYLFHNYHDMDNKEWCRQFERLGGNG